MSTTYARLTVFFDAPFWIGLYERAEDGGYTACKLVFGAEPKDYEVLEQLLIVWRKMRFSPPVAAGMPEERRMNPKRQQREIRRELERPVIGTKAQQALALEREQRKAVSRKRSHAEREAEEFRRFSLRQAKRKEKHKGH